jgi:hypothetical protein
MRRRKFFTLLLAQAIALTAARNAQAARASASVIRQDSIIVPSGTVLEPPPGERWIYTRNDGGPPTLDIQASATVRNCWFGGVRDTSPNSVMYLHDDALAEDDCFFGYYGGFAVGGHRNNTISRCQFVNCGGGEFQHPVYISAGNTTLTDNIFVGGEGYPVHFWHHPTWNVVRRNFVGGGERCLAHQGDDNEYVDNLFWSNTVWPDIYLADGARLKYKHNLHASTTGHLLEPFAPDAIVNSNGFLNNTPRFGANPLIYTNATIKALLGVGPYAVNVWVAGLIAEFQKPLEVLAASAFPDYWFGKLADVTAKWADS